jgi:transmembrane sensor
MDRNKLNILAQKYLDGTATPEEKRLLDQWYDTIHTGWPETVNLDKPESEADVRQRMLDKLSNELFVKTPVKVERIPVFSIKRMAKWVGAAAAVLALAYFAWSGYDQSITDKALVSEKKLVQVPLNRVMRLILPDSSKVWLNAGSVFRYPKNFTGKTRVVELVEGRAFFDIRHQSQHPFIVKTRNLNITVLGTSFDVRSYKNEGTTRVSVVTGKVGITMPSRANNQVIMLLPKQAVVLSNKTNQLVKGPVQETEVNAWCKNNFLFEQESLSNVFKALEKEYHAKITVEDKKLLNERISIKLNNQHLDTIMEILSFTKHFNYQMANDSTIIIK